MTENKPQETTSPMANAPAEQPAVPENPEEGKPGKKYPLAGCIALAFAIVFFSGVLSTSKEWYSAFDYLVLNGNFGTMKNAAATFKGVGGTGVKDGFMLALSLIPTVMLAMGVVNIVEGCGGLKVAERLLTPIMRPLMGLPGVVSLALISSTQSTDAGAGMTKGLYDRGLLTEKEKLIFVQFQITGAAAIGNFLSLGSAVFDSILVPIVIPFALILFLKLFAANVTRFILSKYYKEVQ